WRHKAAVSSSRNQRRVNSVPVTFRPSFPPGWEFEYIANTRNATRTTAATGLTSLLLHYLNLKQPRPPFAGDEDAIAPGIVRDAVEPIVGVGILGRREQTAHVDPAGNPPCPRMDPRNPVLLPDVRPDLALDPFQLVEPGDRTGFRDHR